MCLQSKSSIESSHRISKPRRNLNLNLNRLLPSKLCILESRSKWLLANTFGGLQRVGLIRGREKIIYSCMPLFLLCFPLSLFTTFFPFLSQFFFVLSFLLLSSFWVPLPLGASVPPFYSELLLLDFFLLPLRLYQLFLICYEHSFRIAHQPIGCLAITTTR